MNNSEICKRISEIQGINNNAFERWALVRHPDGTDSHYEHYNPLSDDALWAELIFKHEVSISFVFCKLLINKNGVHEMNFTDTNSLRKNALLLIIKANNKGSNK